jgi:hypothetical protein
MAVVVLAVGATVHARQSSLRVSVLNPSAPRFVTLPEGTDIVVVRHGFAGVELGPYKHIRKLIRDTGMYFVLDACDPSGEPLKVVGPKLVLEYQAETDTWRIGWEYRIKVKKLASGVYRLEGRWRNQEGTVFAFEPTYMTVP